MLHLGTFLRVYDWFNFPMSADHLNTAGTPMIKSEYQNTNNNFCQIQTNLNKVQGFAFRMLLHIEILPQLI